MKKESTFNITIDEQVFAISAEEVAHLDVLESEEGLFHIIQDGKSYTAKLIEADFNKKTLTLSINGNRYELKIEDEYDALVKKMGLSAGGSQKMKNVKAPMPGLILDILIEPGQSVTKGDQLLILEAMKMENVLKAEGEGVVKSVETTKGSAVDKGQILIEME